MTQSVMDVKHVCRCSRLGVQTRQLEDGNAEGFKLVVRVAGVDGLALVAGESFIRSSGATPAFASALVKE